MQDNKIKLNNIQNKRMAGRMDGKTTSMSGIFPKDLEISLKIHT